jgi:monoamine oxidase
MKFFTSIISTLTLVNIAVHASPVERAVPPVCVIGAGPAGLTVAANLEKKGKQVVVFEQKSVVGGKCQAVYKEYICSSVTCRILLTPRSNNYFPLGALLFSNGSYPETLKVINKVGVPATPLVTGPRWQFNWTNGIVVPPPNVTVEFATLVGQEYQRYVQYWTTVFQPYSALRYKAGNTLQCAT